MMKINQIKSKFLGGSFDQNSYVVSNEKSAILIDAGCELDDLLKIVGEKQVLAILITHLHFDHIWNLEEILSYFKCDAYIVSEYDDFLTNPLKNVSSSFGINKVFNVESLLIKYYSENMNIGDFKIQIYNTPGHSKDSVCIKIDDNLFTGDTIFSGAVGRTDLFCGDENELIKSLKKIKDIDFKNVFPGHGRALTKQDILQTIYYEIN